MREEAKLAQGHTPECEPGFKPRPSRSSPELTLPGTGLTASLPGASPRVCPSWRLDQRGGRISFLVCLGLPFTPELFCKDSDPELQQNMPSITVKDRHLCEKRTGGGGGLKIAPPTLNRKFYAKGTE